MKKENIMEKQRKVLTAQWTIIILAAIAFAAYERTLADADLMTAKTAAIFSVAGIRLFLFYRSGQMFQDAVWKGWTGFALSMILSAGIFYYGESLSGVSDNDRYLYHILNGALAFAEAVLGIGYIRRTDYRERMKVLSGRLAEREQQIEVLLQSIEVLSGTADQFAEAGERVVSELRSELEELEASAKVSALTAKKAERWDEVAANYGRIQKRGNRKFFWGVEGLIYGWDGASIDGESHPNGQVLSKEEQLRIIAQT